MRSKVFYEWLSPDLKPLVQAGLGSLQQFGCRGCSRCIRHDCVLKSDPKCKLAVAEPKYGGTLGLADEGRGKSHRVSWRCLPQQQQEKTQSHSSVGAILIQPGTDMMITGPQELRNAGSPIETSLTGPELRCSGLAHHSHRTVQSETRKAIPFLKLVAAEHLG